MSPEQFAKVREYEAGVHDLLRKAVTGKTLAEQLEEVKEEDLEMTEEDFEALGQEQEMLEDQGRELGQKLRQISYQVSQIKSRREEYCFEHYGHEWDDDNGMTCMACGAINDNEPDYDDLDD